MQLTAPGKGKAFTDRGVRRMIAARAKDAGLGVLSPHKLRSSYASALAANGRPIDEIMRLLGHTNIQTTQIYVLASEERLESAVKSLPDVLDVMPMG